ncbi:gluconate operon transcriptional repressor GntR [Vibrio gangliei]|uniref:gluconate operon transcriptional repressor GntR n=1 Tax=Vibrio gangliei TaxID=2077090 RepID=UPI000D019515|nr:gluconate operon transcriptional repressor GntR [Vibrio gangliei]
MVTKNKRPTLQDVAEQVGVTKMTVSRCLRDPNNVSQALREKITQAVEDLGYIPNRAPDILSNAKSHAIGVLVPSLTNQVFAEIIRGIESITEPAGYQLMLAHYSYSIDQEEKNVEMLLSYNVDALILSESHHSERTRKMIKTAGVPVIEIMDTSSPFLEQAIGFDNHAAAKAMTNAMIEHGHHNIIYFAARLDVRTRLKLAGYEAAMLSHGLQPVSLQTTHASSFSLGADLLHKALEEHPNTDGIFCTNDDLAVGAIYECQRLGIQVPQDIGIAGFHGHDLSNIMVPKLATVVTPREQIGVISAQQILNRLNGKPIVNSTIDLGFIIELRDSISHKPA